MSSATPYPDPPPQPPEGGYQVPPGFGAPPPGAGDPALDPLVPPPRSGFDPWFGRLTGTLRRSWRTLGAIVLLTFALPQIVQSLLSVVLGFGIGLTGIEVSSTDPVQVDAGAVAVTVLVAVLLQVVAIFINAIGWGAGIWAVTQEAAGQATTVGDALRAGLRRSAPMFGWFLLLLLMAGVGVIACVLPGIYLFVSGSLFGFVVIYERGRGGIGRSFGLVNRHFSAALGRVGLLILVFSLVPVAAGCLVGTVTGAGTVGLGGAGSVEAAAGLQVLAALVEAAVAVPVTMMMLVGLLLTYTQLRAREEELTTGHLWAAANQS